MVGMPRCDNCGTEFASSPTLGASFRCPKCGSVVFAIKRDSSLTTVLIVVVVLSPLVLCSGMLFAPLIWPAKPANSPPQKAAMPKASAELQAKRKRAIEDAAAAGLVVKLDGSRRTVAVNRRMWDELDFDQKESFAGLWFGYCYEIPLGGRPGLGDSIRILDSKTNSAIATFSASGLTLK